MTALAIGAGTSSGERPDVRHVVGDVEPGQRLPEQQGEEEQHHPAAGRIVADLTIRLAAEHVRQMSQGDAGRTRESGKPRRLAAEKAPEQHGTAAT